MNNKLNSGFTMAEVLMVVALLAVLASVGGVSLVSSIEGFREEKVQDGLVKAVGEARYWALRHNQPTHLVYNPSEKCLEVWDVWHKQILHQQPLDKRIQDLTFSDVLPEIPDRGSFKKPTATALPLIWFGPDSSSTPFQVALKTAKFTTQLKIDPFSEVILNDRLNSRKRTPM